MRTGAVLLLLLGLARTASASHATVVVLSEPTRADDLGAALQVALTGRGVAIASAAAPDGELWLDRAAAAQRAAMAVDAEAAIWIDEGELSVVSADGKTFRHAPLGDDSPRLFAAIATSLIDEMLAQPGSPDSIDVDVRFDIGLPPGATPVAGVQAGTPVADKPAPLPNGMVRGDKTLFEIGPMASPYTAGLEAEVAFPLSGAMRLGLNAAGNVLLWDGKHDSLWLGGVELRSVGSGASHNDWGPVGGVAFVEGSAAAYVGVRLSHVWEHDRYGTEISLVPVIATNGTDTIPGVYATLRWAVPL